MGLVYFLALSILEFVCFLALSILEFVCFLALSSNETCILELVYATLMGQSANWILFISFLLKGSALL
jgi:hypothetical protein